MLTIFSRLSATEFKLGYGHLARIAEPYLGIVDIEYPKIIINFWIAELKRFQVLKFIVTSSSLVSNKKANNWSKTITYFQYILIFKKNNQLEQE